MGSAEAVRHPPVELRCASAKRALIATRAPLLHEPPVAQEHGSPFDVCTGSLAFEIEEALDRGHGEVAGSLGDGERQAMIRVALDGGRDPQHLVGSDPRSGHDVDAFG